MLLLLFTDRNQAITPHRTLLGLHGSTFLAFKGRGLQWPGPSRAFTGLPVVVVVVVVVVVEAVVGVVDGVVTLEVDASNDFVVAFLFTFND